MPTPMQRRQPVVLPGEHRQLHYRSTNTPKHSKGPRLLTALFSILALLALIHFLIVMHTSTMQAAAPATCSHLIRNTDYTRYVQFDPTSQQVGAIQYVDQLAGGQPAALVQVTDAQHTLDVYLYGCVMQHATPTLTVLLKQQGLTQGTISLSKANTLVLGERDTMLAQDLTAVLQPMQQNLYQEYRWQQGLFVQVAFPGLYPVTDRSEAEALQEQANNGASLPWIDPQATAEQMAKDILQWSSSDYQEKTLDNDGTTTHILLEQKQPEMAVTVTLTRLIQKDAKGLWFVTGAQTQGVTLDQSQFSAPVTSPITLDGTITTKDGQATAALFDHTLTAMSSLNNTTLTITADGKYTGSILYSNNKQTQQGLLLIENVPPSKSSEAGQLLLTSVILG